MTNRKGLLTAILLTAVFGTLPLRVAAQRETVTAAQVNRATEAQSEARPETKSEAGEPNDEYRKSPMVTKLGAMVGMDPDRASAAFTITNLLILLAGIGYLLCKNLPKSFRSRSTTIKKQLVDARSATEEAKARLTSVEDRLSKLDGQIAEMKSHAAAEGEKEALRLKDALEDEKARILASAKVEIQSATTHARRELQKYAAELAVEQAAHKLVVTPEADRSLIEGFGERLQSFGKARN